MRMLKIASDSHKRALVDAEAYWHTASSTMQIAKQCKTGINWILCLSKNLLIQVRCFLHVSRKPVCSRIVAVELVLYLIGQSAVTFTKLIAPRTVLQNSKHTFCVTGLRSPLRATRVRC